jgi:hypothetical protein
LSTTLHHIAHDVLDTIRHSNNTKPNNGLNPPNNNNIIIILPSGTGEKYVPKSKGKRVRMMIDH